LGLDWGQATSLCRLDVIKKMYKTLSYVKYGV